MRLYEGFFLIDSNEASRNLDAIYQNIEEILKKYGAEIVRSGKWADRKLAYEIKGIKRGTYLLFYFCLDPQKLEEVRREFRIYEKVVRVMFLREERTKEEILRLDTLAYLASETSSSGASSSTTSGTATSDSGSDSSASSEAEPEKSTSSTSEESSLDEEEHSAEEDADESSSSSDEEEAAETTTAAQDQDEGETAQ
ncbi:MAG: 30S ribosomal protein S6 [Planctomycetota bacterium]|nr:MAG: 30S ribosomal protein S6 [Planctomycetota bacterium]